MCWAICRNFRRMVLLPALLLAALPSTNAAADAIFLKSGRQLNVAVREISEGVVYFVSSGEIHSLPLAETRKIIITGAPAGEAAAPEAAPARAAATAPAAPVRPSAPPPPLETINTVSNFDRGVLTVQGEARNNTNREIKFVQLIVTLHDEEDTVLATSYLYVPGPNPHLAAGETRPFRASFLNPPPTTYKYKVRTESRYLQP